MRRKFAVPEVFVPSVLLLWLLISLPLWLLIPRAEAQATGPACPSPSEAPRAGVYPRAAAMLLIAGALTLLLPLSLSGVIFAVAVAWMGYVLFAARGEETPQPTRA